MTFPGLSPEEIRQRDRRNAELDAKIAAAKRELERKQAEAMPKPLGQLLPNPVQKWITNRISFEATQSVKDAQLAYHWALYHRTYERRRPMYPRRRAISPSNKSYNRDFQTYHRQQQSKFFKVLPPELRAEIYRAYFGRLLIELEATNGGRNGPPGSESRLVLWGSKIEDADTGLRWGTGINSPRQPNNERVSYIIPLLQTCRQM
jgi:hypothetical protein